MTKITKQFSLKKRILYSFITCLCFFILSEFIARVYFYAKYHNYHTSVSTQGSPLQIDDSNLVFKNSPFYLDYKYRYQNNEYGMRSEPKDVFIPEKSINDYWVLLTGASAMEGMGSNKDGEWLDITGVEEYPFDKTIAYKLQVLLQNEMPNKKVKVFNGANSSFILWQSFNKYKEVKDKIKPDFVISLDGNNEFSSLENNENVKELLRKNWESTPIFKFPSKYIIPFTKNSYLINALKQYIYHFKNSVRLSNNIKNDFPSRKKWLDTTALNLRIDSINFKIENAVNFYTKILIQYDSTLNSDGIKHFLVYQPFLFNKSVANMNKTEIALFNYYTYKENNGEGQKFKQVLRNKLQMLEKLNPNLFVLDADSLSGANQTFVDYCHYTENAADSIAMIFANKIIKSL